MRASDFLPPRPRLTNTTLIARAVAALGQGASSQTEIWHRLTERFAVDLDAVAALVPRRETEPLWLRARD